MIAVRGRLFSARAFVHVLCTSISPATIAVGTGDRIRPTSTQPRTATPTKNTFIVLHFCSGQNQNDKTAPHRSDIVRPESGACSTPPLTIYPDCEMQHTALVSTQTAYGWVSGQQPPNQQCTQLRETRPRARARVCSFTHKTAHSMRGRTHVARSLCVVWRASLLITVYHI